jgi:hypothetical protein
VTHTSLRKKSKLTKNYKKMNTTSKILEDKIALINWITELNDNKVLDKLRFLMDNYPLKKVVTLNTEEVQNEETSNEDEETSKKAINQPNITNADDEVFNEDMKKRFPDLFK